ncbi:MAG: phytanoyl-CoA dioxygenase family protein [Gemmatimonadota bacterium]|nr:phytanoyl-CoA dioxygenase family protein [Gemmatimonadota bacterium]
MALTEAELRQYEEQGAVTVDSPFTTAELDRAEAAWDRLTESGRPFYEEPDYLDVFQHPYFEEVARDVLRADGVHLWWGVSPHGRHPSNAPFGSVRDQWAGGCHTDIQATLDDFQATPRRMRAELWFWLNDVPEHRGAMRVIPGSHRPIMEYWSRVLTPEHKAMLPRVHGVRPDPKEGAPAYPEHVPDLADSPWLEQEPTPMVARRGQMLILCSSGLHSAWQNEDTVPRKAMLSAYAASGVSCGLPKGQRDALMSFFPKLRRRLRPDRAHIVPEDFDWLFESNYEPKWPETFIGT